jgi:uncharacterized membrane protein
MDKLHAGLLVLHIIAGSIGLLSGTINLIGRKGGIRHKLVGKIFTWAMLTAGFSAIGLAIINPSPFLVIIGIFTIYMVATGYRYIRLRKAGGIVNVGLIDWTLCVGMALIGIIFLVQGTMQVFKGHSFGSVYLVFGVVSLFFVKSDVVGFRGGSRFINFWQTAHLQRMIGAYIASLTAFLVVNYSYFPEVIPGWVFWLLPSALLTPLIIFWSNKFGILKSK